MKPLLQVEDLVQHYSSGNLASSRTQLTALRNASLSIPSGRTLALVGASGSGKSTLARCIAGLERPAGGRIWFNAVELTALSEKSLRVIRPQIQLIFQDPVRSLNPRLTALDSVSEPLVIQRSFDNCEVHKRVIALLESVGLSREMATAPVQHFSSGQKQRLAIARALILKPKLLILDEVTSALDASVQAQIVNLLLDLQSSFGLTYLFITHDLALAAHLGDEIALMDDGRIVQQAATDKLPITLRSRNKRVPETLDMAPVAPEPTASFAGRFLLRRMTHALFLLFGVSALTFLFTSLAPGDYFEEMRLNPQIAPETVSALRVQYRLNQSLPVRYASWVNSLARGRLGFSFSYNGPVGPLLWSRARNTLLLTVIGMVLAWGLALPLGIWSAEHRGRIQDSLVSWAMSVLLVIPDLVLGLILLLFAVRSGWFPTRGLLSIGADRFTPLGKLRDGVSHLVLPVLVLALTTLPVLVKHVRAAVSDVLDAPFIQTARGHGIPRRRLMYRYALPAAANPLISLLGLSIGALLGGSLLVEVVMGWPGLGPLLVEAILSRDLYVVIGGVLLSTLFLVFGNFIADLLLYWADPRIRPEPAR